MKFNKTKIIKFFVIVAIIISIISFTIIFNKNHITTSKSQIIGDTNQYTVSSSDYEEVDGIQYSLNTNNKTASVYAITASNIAGGASVINTYSSGSNYGLAVNIPQVINVDGVSYTVNTIGTGTNILSTPMISNLSSYKESSGYDITEITVILPRTTERITQAALQISSGASSITANGLKVINLSNKTTYDVNCMNVSDKLSLYAVPGSGVDIFTASYKNLYTYSTFGNNATITGFNGAFENIPDIALVNIKFPEFLTSNGTRYTVTGIGEGAFRGKKRLKNIIFPATVTNIGSAAFMDCESIEIVKFYNSKTKISDNVFLGCSITGMYALKNSTADQYYKQYAGEANGGIEDTNYYDLVITSFSIDSTLNRPSKSKYTVGETFDGTGYVFRLSYDDGNSSYITGKTDGITFSPTTVTNTPSQTIEATYEGQKTSFTVNVEEKTTTQTYTITLNKDGGTEGTSTIYLVGDSEDNLKLCKNSSGDAISDSNKIEIPKKDGCRFLGYYFDNYTREMIDENGGIGLSLEGENPGILLKDFKDRNITELKAKWETTSSEDPQSSTIEITLNKNGGTGGTSTIYLVGDSEDNLKLCKNSSGDPISDSNKIEIPKKDGYEFLGYYFDDYTRQMIDENGGIGLSLEGANPGILLKDFKDRNIKEMQAQWKEAAKTEVKVEEVTIQAQQSEIKVGGTTVVTATVKPDDATNKKVTYKSSNETIATVTSSGIVKGIKAGEVTITATTEDGGKTASCKITVKEEETNTPGEDNQGNTDKETEAPVINKVEVGKDEDGNNILYITATDSDSGIEKVSVNGKDITSQKTEDGRYYYKLEKDGDYEITVIDKAGNKISKTLTWKAETNNNNNNNNGSGSGSNNNNNNGSGSSSNNNNNNNGSGSGSNNNNNNNGSGSDSNNNNNNNGSGNSSNNNNNNNSGSGTTQGGNSGSSSNSNNNKSQSSISGTNGTDSSMSSSILPKTGETIGIILGIGIIVFGVYSLVKYRKLNFK